LLGVELGCSEKRDLALYFLMRISRSKRFRPLSACWALNFLAIDFQRDSKLSLGTELWRLALSPDLSKVVGELLANWRKGDQGALQALVPIVYDELRALAHLQLRRERPGHTLQTTALVNETYLRLVGQRPFDVEDRVHFVAVAARLMRQILVDYARSRRAAKRGADLRVDLGQVELLGPEEDATFLPFRIGAPHLISIHEALSDLAQIDEQQSRIVELRFFGGLTVEEAAEVLSISRSTAKRDWKVAKAWLSRQVRRSSHGRTSTMAKDQRNRRGRSGADT
jgi:RNA polymerase sigma factor (TIGR02999 family)